MKLEEKCEQEISVHGTNKDNRWNKMVANFRGISIKIGLM
jgi:hypothetical protein